MKPKYFVMLVYKEYIASFASLFVHLINKAVLTICTYKHSLFLQSQVMMYTKRPKSNHLLQYL